MFLSEIPHAWLIYQINRTVATHDEVRHNFDKAYQRWLELSLNSPGQPKQPSRRK